MQLFLYHACIECFGYAPREAASLCGLSDPRLIVGRAGKVLGDGDTRRLHQSQTTEALSEAAVSYVCRGDGMQLQGTPVPVMAPVLMRWLRAAGGSAARPQLETDDESKAHDIEQVFSALWAELDGFVNAFLSYQLKHRQRVEDAKQRVCGRVCAEDAARHGSWDPFDSLWDHTGHSGKECWRQSVRQRYGTRAEGWIDAASCGRTCRRLGGRVPVVSGKKGNRRGHLPRRAESCRSYCHRCTTRRSAGSGGAGLLRGAERQGHT
jgi:hypothetical protein